MREKKRAGNDGEKERERERKTRKKLVSKERLCQTTNLDNAAESDRQHKSDHWLFEFVFMS